MKLFDNKIVGTVFTEEEINKLRINYLEICARIRNCEQYSTEEAEYIIDEITRIGDTLFEPQQPSLLISFYELVYELLD